MTKCVKLLKILKFVTLLFNIIIFCISKNKEFVGIYFQGDVMVSTGVLKIGIAIRRSGNCVIKPEKFKTNDKDYSLLAA